MSAIRYELYVIHGIHIFPRRGVYGIIELTRKFIIQWNYGLNKAIALIKKIFLHFNTKTIVLACVALFIFEGPELCNYCSSVPPTYFTSR